MGINKSLLAAALVLMTTACSSGVRRDANLEVSQPQLSSTGQQAGQVTIAMAPEVEQRLAGTTRFDQVRFRNSIESALRAKNALAPADDPTLPTVEVDVTDVRLRGTATVMLFGMLSGDDHINGTVTVRSPDKTELQKFQVTTTALLSMSASVGSRMAWLSKEFAKQLADELTGAHAQSASKQ